MNPSKDYDQHSRGQDLERSMPPSVNDNPTMCSGNPSNNYSANSRIHAVAHYSFCHLRQRIHLLHLLLQLRNPKHHRLIRLHLRHMLLLSPP
ncbi:hypothetical protein DH2020_015790 [Rehmannia glutinosa]|uniref:Uncharacterized protein n=1 Tax=Rehmannia glutinosa TaxID=99300 RepID=A0ABR0WVA4_REHGL